jgi:hypothetical protein
MTPISIGSIHLRLTTATVIGITAVIAMTWKVRPLAARELVTDRVSETVG